MPRRTPPALLKKQFNIKLPAWLILWLRRQDACANFCVETALVQHFGISAEDIAALTEELQNERG